MKEFFQTHKPDQGEKIEITDSGNLPNEVIKMLQDAETNSYANGFFRFIAPNKLKHYFSIWNLPVEDCSPFIKCAFGHLVFYHQRQYKVLNPVFNSIDIIGEENELDFVMNIMLCDRDVLESSFFINIYEKTFGRLGAPDINEMYAFIPALRLGGSPATSFVQKVEMDLQMTLLSQI